MNDIKLGLLTVKPTPMKISIIPIVTYAQQRLRGSAHPTEELQMRRMAGPKLNTKASFDLFLIDYLRTC